MAHRESTVFIRSCVVESARRICQQVTSHGDDPCRDCIYTAAQMHAAFLRDLPPAAARMSPDVLTAAILSAGLDA